MSGYDQDSTHCGLPGCPCPHVVCDRGFVYVSERVVEWTDAAGETRRAEHEQVAPCPGCKPDSARAVRLAWDRADMGRRLRSVGDEVPDG